LETKLIDQPDLFDFDSSSGDKGLCEHVHKQSILTRFLPSSTFYALQKPNCNPDILFKWDNSAADVVVPMMKTRY